MIVTEAEAAKRWCPFAREAMTSPHDGFGQGAANRSYRSEPISMCIGSNCMAWRWLASPGPAPETPPDVRASWCGFCGLAYSVRLP